MESTTQRFRFIAVTVLSILALTIIGATFLLPAYATGSLTLFINSPVPLNVGIVFSGTETPSPAFPPGNEINVAVYTGAGCTTFDFGTLAGSTGPTGGYNSGGALPASAAGVGSYSAIATDLTTHVSSLCEPFSIVPATPPIPEYPFGLAVLAIFMVVAYGIIRRKTRNTQP